MSEECPNTVFQWMNPSGIQYRTRITPRPGSTHWNILREYQLPDEDEWKRYSADEARYKPIVNGDD